jgi:Protein of unknown function (DUF2950)
VQKTFASPEGAAAVFAAAKAGDQTALLAIFGPESKDILYSGDAVKDSNNAKNFVTPYNQMNRWSRTKAGGEILYVGADNYAFPIAANVASTLFARRTAPRIQGNSVFALAKNTKCLSPREQNSANPNGSCFTTDGRTLNLPSHRVFVPWACAAQDTGA